jgi:hypothetical protein
VKKPEVTVTPFYKRRIDSFTRWLLRAEAKNRKAGKPGYKQKEVVYSCGTPACMGGYLDAYIRTRLRKPSLTGRWSHSIGFSSDDPVTGPSWSGGKHNGGVFGSRGCDGAKTALQAVNYLRNLVGLPRLTREDAK